MTTIINSSPLVYAMAHADRMYIPFFISLSISGGYSHYCLSEVEIYKIYLFDLYQQIIFSFFYRQYKDFPLVLLTPQLQRNSGEVIYLMVSVIQIVSTKYISGFFTYDNIRDKQCVYSVYMMVIKFKGYLWLDFVIVFPRWQVIRSAYCNNKKYILI